MYLLYELHIYAAYGKTWRNPHAILIPLLSNQKPRIVATLLLFIFKRHKISKCTIWKAINICPSSTILIWFPGFECCVNFSHRKLLAQFWVQLMQINMDPLMLIICEKCFTIFLRNLFKMIVSKHFQCSWLIIIESKYVFHFFF